SSGPACCSSPRRSSPGRCRSRPTRAASLLGVPIYPVHQLVRDVLLGGAVHEAGAGDHHPPASAADPENAADPEQHETPRKKRPETRQGRGGRPLSPLSLLSCRFVCFVVWAGGLAAHFVALPVSRTRLSIFTKSASGRTPTLRSTGSAPPLNSS